MRDTREIPKTAYRNVEQWKLTYKERIGEAWKKKVRKPAAPGKF